jgi:hypothetical protein
MPEVSREAALTEFERLAETAGVDIDITDMTEGETEEVEELTTAFAKAIMSGLLSVNDEGLAVLAPVVDIHGNGEPFRFRLPLGADLMIMANATEEKRMEALARFVCAITGQSTKRIGGLGVKEWKLAMRLAGFLSAA